jgi:hypothetical protein
MSITHTSDNGKYTVVWHSPPDHPEVALYALRHGEPWRDLIGDGLILSLLLDIDALKGKVEDLKADLKESNYETNRMQRLLDDYEWTQRGDEA